MNITLKIGNIDIPAVLDDLQAGESLSTAQHEQDVTVEVKYAVTDAGVKKFKVKSIHGKAFIPVNY